jgi:hypothetical protein
LLPGLSASDRVRAAENSKIRHCVKRKMAPRSPSRIRVTASRFQAHAHGLPSECHRMAAISCVRPPYPLPAGIVGQRYNSDRARLDTFLVFFLEKQEFEGTRGKKLAAGRPKEVGPQLSSPAMSGSPACISAEPRTWTCYSDRTCAALRHSCRALGHVLRVTRGGFARPCGPVRRTVRSVKRHAPNSFQQAPGPSHDFQVESSVCCRC